MLEADEPTFMGLPHAISPADLKGVDAAIIGAPYVASWTEYAGVPKSEWIAGPKRVRQQSIRYESGYIQDFDLDVFEHLKVVDFGDAAIPPEAIDRPTVENILRAQAAVEEKVNQALDAGALPIVIGQNSPCGSYAIAKPIAERTRGNVGVISLDTHWDSRLIDRLTMDARIAGSGGWKRKMYEFHNNITPRTSSRSASGACSRAKRSCGISSKGRAFLSDVEGADRARHRGTVRELEHAYAGTDAVYVHFDMDVLGGAGPAPGDILGELAEPIGMSDYEVIRMAHEIGKRGLTGSRSSASRRDRP